MIKKLSNNNELMEILKTYNSVPKYIAVPLKHDQFCS